MPLLADARRKVEADTIDLFLRSVPNEYEDDATRLGFVWKALPVAGSVGDAITTVVAIHRSNGRIHEGNPIVAPLVNSGIAGQVAYVALKMGIGAGMAYAGTRMARSGHQTAAKIATGVAGALGFGAAAYNIRLARRIGHE